MEHPGHELTHMGCGYYRQQLNSLYHNADPLVMVFLKMPKADLVIGGRYRLCLTKGMSAVWGGWRRKREGGKRAPIKLGQNHLQ